LYKSHSVLSIACDDLTYALYLQIKCFTHWIEKESPDKWSLLHDTYGARYGIMTSNLAEVYNWVLRGSRGLPLVAIVESVLHGTTKWFQDRYTRAGLHIQNNPTTPYCAVVMAYMEEKSKKGQGHMARQAGNAQRRFEVTLRHRTGFGISVEERTQEVQFDGQSGCTCTCNKPLLYHKSCSHVLAAAAKTKMEPRAFVSGYYMKEAVFNTWSGEFWGYRIVGNFTSVAVGHRVYIPSMNLLRATKIGRRKTRRIRNDMDEGEAGGPTRQCLYCLNFGHRMKYCPKLREERANEGADDQGQSSTAAAVAAQGRNRRRRVRRQEQTGVADGSAI